jgi:large subunit ribosomal protein L9
MKLILTREVAKLGTAGDVVTVKDGYAREIRDIDHAKEIKAALEAAKVTVAVKTGTAGRLFGSVTDKDIAAAIKSVAKIDVDRHNIKTSGHIKKTGNYSVKVSLGHNVVATVAISVTAA